MLRYMFVPNDFFRRNFTRASRIEEGLGQFSGHTPREAVEAACHPDIDPDHINAGMSPGAVASEVYVTYPANSLYSAPERRWIGLIQVVSP